MSPAIGIALFVIGVGALLLSIVLDHRPVSRQPAPAPDATADVGSGTPDEERAASVAEVTEVALVAESGPAPDPPEPATSVPAAAAADTAVGHPEPAPSNRAATAEARLETLRAEFAGRGTQAVSATPQPAASPEPPPIGEPSARPDAGRVFAAVASVGRAPQEDGSGPSSAAEPEPEPVAPEPPGELGAVTGSEPAAVEHGHAIPIVSHSDLVSHLRREHPDLESGGSTIQMRRLHDGVHAS
ncbi:MAG: hypothetical protein ACM3WR_06840 [Solirubrobacterales bacterium]